jgi:hypothetical protein
MKYIRKPIIVDALQNEDTTWTITSSEGINKTITNEEFVAEYALTPHIDIVVPDEEQPE